MKVSIKPLSLLLSCLFAWPLAAQSTRITGSVRDDQGRPVSAATLHFRSTEMNFRREVQTDADGRFDATGFLPGRYQVTLRRESFVLWSSVVELSSARPEHQLDIELEPPQPPSPSMSAEERLHALHVRGVRFLNENRPEEALQEFRAGVELAPERALLHSLLGSAYDAADQPENALAAHRRALELEPSEAAHHNNVGVLLARAGRWEEALPHFERAARLDPARAATYQFNRGAALLNAGNADDAVGPLRKATRADSTLAVAHYFLGVALVESGKSGKPRDAIDAFRRYLDLEPDGPYAGEAREQLAKLGVTPPA